MGIAHRSAVGTPELLAEAMAAKPLMYACDALGVRCQRLEEALAVGAQSSGASSSAIGYSSSTQTDGVGDERQPERNPSVAEQVWICVETR